MKEVYELTFETTFHTTTCFGRLIKYVSYNVLSHNTWGNSPLHIIVHFNQYVRA